MKNFFLTLKNRLRYYLRKDTLGNFHPAGLLSLDLNFSAVQSIDQHFERGFAWGEYHPDKLNTYFDNDCMELVNNMLQLYFKLKPKQFNAITIPYGYGVVRSKKKFKYGYFEAELKLPETKHTWPAFWLTGVNSWPPEIDILEGYSNDTATFHRGRKLQSNIHFGTKENNKDAGAKNHFLHDYKGFNKYGVLWTKDEISFYYNRHLVRTIKDNLEYFNQPMEVIFGNGPQEGCDLLSSTMEVKSLKVW